MPAASAPSAPTLGEAEEDPRALAETGDEPGFSHQLQMTADARLALPEDLGEVLDVQLGGGKQRENAQARGLAGRAEHREALSTRKTGRAGLGSLVT